MPTLRTRVLLAGLVAAGMAGMARAATAQKPMVLDVSVSSRANYERAEFRLWYVPSQEPIHAVVVMVPGSNGDGRSMVDDSAWQRFAVRHHVALVGCYFTDRSHPEEFIEEYAAAARGSGQALLDALASFAARSRHPELARAPLLLWGMSAGGEYNYEFTAWKPERVLGFVANKGGIYYSALVSREARNVPGLVFIGKKDIAFRTNTLAGLFAVNRRAGALWALAEEPGVAHEVGRSQDMTLIFFEDLLALAVDSTSSNSSKRGGKPVPLRRPTEDSGFWGDLDAKSIQAVRAAAVPDRPTAWLPTERSAKAWQAVVSGKPVEP